MAFFSNSRKVDYTPIGGDAVFRCPSNIVANTRICYWFRNIGHDFTHYIIGFVDDPMFRTIAGNSVDTSAPGFIWAIRRWRFLFFPYVAYWGIGIKSYLGWRPDGGFGIKLRRE